MPMPKRPTPERPALQRSDPDSPSPDLSALALPIVHARSGHDVGHFHVEALDLEFSNGERRNYERLHSQGHGAVIIAALPDPNTILLVREYACGMHRYELGLPKGRMDAGETPLAAANRELKEEAGFGARDLRVLRMLTLAPTYMSHEIHLVLARDLYPERLPGDEPEPLQVVPWRLDALHELALRVDCSEGRSLAAIFLVRELLRRGLPA
jgi:ADP-ribose diphosphatase